MFPCDARPSSDTYTLSLHDALPIFEAELIGEHDLIEIAAVGLRERAVGRVQRHHEEPELHQRGPTGVLKSVMSSPLEARSEEHTSELQSPCNLVCRLLLEKKKKDNT